MIRGDAKFDGLAVGEISATLLGHTVELTAKAAFINSTSGETHGWTSNKQWSPGVIEKLRELRALMEVDFARIHFVGVEGTRAESGAVPFAGSPAGIAEHLSAVDAPSI